MTAQLDLSGVTAAVFDLDGVITDTASVHLSAWTRLFDRFLEERASQAAEDEDLSPFTPEDYRRDVDGRPRQDGIRSFLASRGIEVDEDTIAALGERKNTDFLERLDEDGVAVFDSTVRLVHRLHLHGVRTAVFSASRNAGPVLERAGLAELFEARVDGLTAADLDLPGKPDPAVPLEAARRLGADAAHTMLVEDARAGVEAGRRGGFAHVVGIARDGDLDDLRRHGADVVVSDLRELELTPCERALSQVPDAEACLGAVTGLLTGTQPAVFLDVDGTLAPIVDDPDDAALAPGMREVLAALVASCPTAIVSGRDLDDVRARVDVPGLWVAGSHGFELLDPDGTRHEEPRAGDTLPALDAAERELRAQLGGVPGVEVERKRFAIAVHTRRAEADDTARAERAVEDVASSTPGLRATGGRAVRELRPDLDWDKGAALGWVLEQLPDTGDTGPRLPLYAGDDLTDEDALRVVQPRGLGVVVASDEHGDRGTYAHVAVPDPEHLRALLARLTELIPAGADTPGRQSPKG
ncbi:MAG: trehalose-phosphatase [Nitriliruptoraceae bacterium]